ncbi:MAG: SelT/SelW/SelH family protein [Nitrospirae bacterium]|nr:MAG: SelT/SelW/SelH family protein [Nitrospirota bacterium]
MDTTDQGSSTPSRQDSVQSSERVRVEIEYCTQCRWLLRAAWMAQELLMTFESELGEVALIPGAGGVFEVRVQGHTIWSRVQQGRFPEAKELKQLIRDRVAPNKNLGHSDRPISGDSTSE